MLLSTTPRTVLYFIAAVAIFWPSLAHAESPPSTALHFTADGQYILVPHTEELDTIGGELTVEAWVKPDAIILSRGYSSIVSKQLNGTGYMSASNLLGPAPGFKAEVAGIQVTSEAQPGAGAWQHVAAVWDGQLKIYVNGQFSGIITPVIQSPTRSTYGLAPVRLAQIPTGVG